MKCLICQSERIIYLYLFSTYKFYKCQNCQIIFIHPFPTSKKLDQYYKNFQYNLGFESENIIRSDANRSLNNIENMIERRKEIRILDIGCGAGFLLDEARKRNWIVRGIDSSKKATQYALRALKIPVINESFMKCKIDNQKYDVITLIQVIEHLPNPVRFFNKVYKLLNKNGILCIATPNINSFLSKIMKKDFNYLIPPEHLFYYSDKSLINLLSKKYVIKKIDTYGYEDDLSRIIRKVIRKEKWNNPNLHITVKKETKNQNEIKSSKRRILEYVSQKCYPLLNINNSGSMIEIYGQKV